MLKLQFDETLLYYGIAYFSLALLFIILCWVLYMEHIWKNKVIKEIQKTQRLIIFYNKEPEVFNNTEQYHEIWKIEDVNEEGIINQW